MKSIFRNITIVSLALATLVLFTNCEATRNANNSQKGTVIGAAGGAILGAVLGNNIGKGGNGELGAVIGGVAGGAAGAIIGRRMDNQAKKIETEIPGAQVERVDDGIVVTFDENSGVYFDTNKYNINSKSMETLDKLTGVLREYPDTDVLVIGHTDSTGSDTYNMTLSKQRAESVTSYFTVTKGLGSGRFTTNWYGEQSPVADNSTAEGRAQNRRVNVVIVPNEKMVNDAEQEANKG
tara:strand:- start:17094 stop:17804 length:711 start_codon:yes stop_codon:yes gene_type:complete